MGADDVNRGRVCVLKGGAQVELWIDVRGSLQLLEILFLHASW